MSDSNDGRLKAILGNVDHAGVYHLPLDGAAEVVAAAAANSLLVFRVDLGPARDKDSLLDAIARAMAFPEWFGTNWDALLDSLADLGWRPAEGYVVILEHCDGIHGRAEADFVQTLQVFAQAADEWREQGIAFWCLVDMSADGIDWLTDIA